MRSRDLLRFHGLLNLQRESYIPPNGSNAFDFMLSIDAKLLELEELILSLYLIDRNYPRETELTHQVEDLNAWASLREPIQELFSFLTDRNLILSFEKATTRRTVQTRLFNSVEESNWAPTVVCLFSGGLDSAAGVLSFQKPEEPLLSHTLTGKIMYGRVLSLRNHPKIISHGLILTDSQVRNITPGRSRLRGLLFLTNAALVASSFGLDRVVLPENGPLMINPQVSELSPQPTRNAHPHLTRRLEEILTDLRQRNFSIDCIFKEKTKAEVVASVAGETQLVNKTYSCFTVQGQKKMCGICYACYVRSTSALCVNYEEPHELYDMNPFRVDIGSLGRVSTQKIHIIKDSLSFCKSALSDDNSPMEALDSVPTGFFNDPVELLRNFAKEMLLGTHLHLQKVKTEELNALGKFALEMLSKEIDFSLLESRREELLKLVQNS